MPSIDIALLLAVLSCIWVCIAAKALVQFRTPKSQLKLLAAIATCLLLALSALSTELVINMVAGSRVTPASSPFTPSRVASEPVPVIAAHSIGVIETTVERNRTSAATMVLALLASLGLGVISGLRSRTPSPSERSSELPRGAA